jgi:hypothetical protein
MDPLASLARTFGHQDGLVSRSQVLGAGGDDALIERMIRQRRWSRVHPGVYIDHTGPLGWDQRAWAAVLYTAPSALAGKSALRAHGVRGQDVSAEADIEVVVDHRRRVRTIPGLRIDRLVDFDRVVQSHLSPPRVTIEHALLRIASTAPSDDTAVAVLADGCQSWRTAPSRLAAELDQTVRIFDVDSSHPCSTTSPRARTPHSKAAISMTSNAPMRCPVRVGSAGTTMRVDRSATSCIRPRPRSSSSTDAWATSGPQSVGTISTATSTAPRRVDSPSARGGARCSSPAGSRSAWRASWWLVVGAIDRGRADQAVSWPEPGTFSAPSAGEVPASLACGVGTLRSRRSGDAGAGGS